MRNHAEKTRSKVCWSISGNEDRMLQSATPKRRVDCVEGGYVVRAPDIIVDEISYPVALVAPREERRCVYLPVPQARSTGVGQ